MPGVLVRKYRMAHFQALVALLVASYSSTGSGHNNLHVASAHINKNISTASDSSLMSHQKVFNKNANYSWHSINIGSPSILWCSYIWLKKFTK